MRPLALKASLDKALIQPAHYECDPEGGIGLHLLHAEPDHSLAVFMVSWLPGRGVTPHDHGTWAVVAGVDGPEVNTFWKRLDDGTRAGYAELAPAGEQAIDAGEVVSMLPEGIHSVRNDSHRITLSLHTYGIDPGHSPRYQYDVDARSVRPHPRSALGSPAQPRAQEPLQSSG